VAAARLGIFAPVGPFAGDARQRKATLFATVAQEIADHAGGAGRDPDGFEHTLNVWCGVGASREGAREPLAAGMQSFYQMPFEAFERYSPYGSPEDVAAFLHEYVDAGCTVFNVIPCAAHHHAAVGAVRELRAPLN
jgi:alkanesulfonate monooxygenase SsuD/methylene tetrahydromethanopterin reductase-like flavin-dependent oxidoreductase (luciferase family)